MLLHDINETKNQSSVVKDVGKKGRGVIVGRGIVEFIMTKSADGDRRCHDEGFSTHIASVLEYIAGWISPKYHGVEKTNHGAHIEGVQQVVFTLVSRKYM